MCSDYSYVLQPTVAKTATDLVERIVYLGKMDTKASSEWLQKAIETSGISQAKLARELSDLLSTSIDRSTINKVVRGRRKLLANEMVGVHQITGYELPEDIEHRPASSVGNRLEKIFYRLEYARKKSNATLEDAAAALSLPASEIVKIEAGRIAPDHSVIIALAELYSADPNWILFGAGKAPISADPEGDLVNKTGRMLTFAKPKPDSDLKPEQLAARRIRQAESKEIAAHQIQKMDERIAAREAGNEPPNARIGKPIDLFDKRRTIPVFGRASGGPDGVFEMNGETILHATCPPALANIDDGYGVIVSGDSMEPRYFDGEVLYVNPQRRAHHGDFVVAQIQTEEHGPLVAYVKRFSSRSASELTLKQYNPAKDLNFPSDNVKSVHVVIGTGEA